jgi:hypothetical protein
MMHKANNKPESNKNLKFSFFEAIRNDNKNKLNIITAGYDGILNTQLVASKPVVVIEKKSADAADAYLFLVI